MLKLAILSLALLAATPAFAQQPPRQDPQIMVYRQLLDAANAQLAQTVATYEAKIADLNAQIAKLKEPSNAKQDPKASPNDGSRGAQSQVRSQGGDSH